MRGWWVGGCGECGIGEGKLERNGVCCEVGGPYSLNLLAARRMSVVRGLLQNWQYVRRTSRSPNSFTKCTRLRVIELRWKPPAQAEPHPVSLPHRQQKQHEAPPQNNFVYHPKLQNQSSTPKSPPTTFAGTQPACNRSRRISIPNRGKILITTSPPQCPPGPQGQEKIVFP